MTEDIPEVLWLVLRHVTMTRSVLRLNILRTMEYAT